MQCARQTAARARETRRVCYPWRRFRARRGRRNSLDDVFRFAAGDLRQHPQNVFLDRADFGLNLLQWTRRRVAIEVAVEVDFVTDQADLLVLGVALGGVYPRVGDVRPHLAIEESLDGFG